MDDIVTAVKTCLTKYADFKGRAARPEFWWFALAQLIVVMVLGMVSSMLSNLASLALFVPAIAVGARRLHDIGKSGWLQLLWIIPIIGWAILIYWACQPGNPAVNEYGPAPSPAPVPATDAPGQQ